MILDANLLLYAVDTESAHHQRAASWLTDALNGDERVGFPWQTIGDFLRISTHPSLYEVPLTPAEARTHVEVWLSNDQAWLPSVDGRTWRILADITTRHHVTGNLVTDAQLAALALRHGLPVVSADTDFARFPEVNWINPLVG